MKNFAKKMSMLLVVATMMIPAASVFASSTNGQKIKLYSIKDSATMDENVRMTRAGNPELVGSDVSLFTIDWWFYSADGWTNVEDDGRSYNHFSRAELWGDGECLEKDSNQWGYGVVYSGTDNFDAPSNGFSESELRPRIFYGW